MTISRTSVSATPAALALVFLLGSAALPARAQGAASDLVAHTAVYELRLAHSHSNSASFAARGRILYNFSGGSCEGYGLTFRQVLEIDNGEGKVTLSDLHATTWEGGDAKSYRFNSENRINQNVAEAVDGKAERDADKLAVTLTKPEQNKIGLDSTILFPTEHVRKIIEAARAGKQLLEFSVFDGSGNGQKVYRTLAVIGREIPNGQAPTDAAAGEANKAKLVNVRRWPVTLSYYDLDSKKGGEQLPAYSMAFELYENGISRALMLDYNDFTLTGEMTSLDIKDGSEGKSNKDSPASKPCQ